VVLTLENGIISHKFCRIIVCWYISVLFKICNNPYVSAFAAPTLRWKNVRMFFMKVFRMKIGVIADIVVEFTSRPVQVTLDRHEFIQVKCMSRLDIQ